MNPHLQHFYGLGDITKSQGAGMAVSGALAVAAPFSGPAAPFLLAASGISSMIASLFSGCGQTCVRATAIVNQVEPYLKQNLTNYLSLPTPRPMSAKQSALNVFDSAWQQVEAACSDPSLGDAGKRCISDRAPGGKYPWFDYYRNPIANDTNVYDDSTSGQVANAVTQATDYLKANSSIAIPIGLALLGAMLIFGGKE